VRSETFPFYIVLMENGGAMPCYLIYRLKETASQQFRWAPHVSGNTPVKRKDYEEGGRVEAENEYALWSLMKDTDDRLRVGDILEAADGKLSICKYVGFESAEWILPQIKTGLEGAPAASGPPPAPVEMHHP
jgi:hypothetical protein